MNTDYCNKNPKSFPGDINTVWVSPLVKVNIIIPESKATIDLTVKTVRTVEFFDH